MHLATVETLAAALCGEGHAHKDCGRWLPLLILESPVSLLPVSVSLVDAALLCPLVYRSHLKLLPSPCNGRGAVP